MVYENFPEARKEANTNPPANKTNWRSWLTVGLVAALLGTWGYIIWDKNKTTEIIQDQSAKLVTSSSEKDQLRKELDDATMRYDMIKTSSADMAHSKDSVITKRDREITEKRKQIQQILSNANATKQELDQAKTLIASLNEDIAGYRTQVETLEGEKIVLTQEKMIVTRERDKVLKDFDSASNLIRQKDDVIDVGSTLHASNFSIVGINETGGKEKVTSTAKRVDKLRISFDIDENRIAQSGVKNIFICITAPDGKPVAVEAFGSGKFTTRSGEEKFFTQKIDVNYTQGQRQTLSFDWKQNTDYIIGDYKIEVYNNGFKIGEGIRSFKKGGIFS